jgi:hypothetical protein
VPRIVEPSKCVKHCFGYEPPHSHISGTPQEWIPEVLMCTNACPLSGAEASLLYVRSGTSKFHFLVRLPVPSTRYVGPYWPAIGIDCHLSERKCVPNCEYHLPSYSQKVETLISLWIAMIHPSWRNSSRFAYGTVGATGSFSRWLSFSWLWCFVGSFSWFSFFSSLSLSLWCSASPRLAQVLALQTSWI